MKWLHSFIFLSILFRHLISTDPPPPQKFLRAIVCVGHSLYGRRLHVPVVWEVPGYGFGC